MVPLVPMLMKVTFSEQELEAIDRARGKEPRATFVRRTIALEVGASIQPAERSPKPDLENEGPREYIESGGWQRDTREAFASAPVPSLKSARQLLEEQRQEEAGEG